MQSFFETVIHRWPAGQEDYHWHLLFPEDLVSQQLVEPYRGLTHGRDQLRPVPARWVHLTLLHSGPVGQISAAELDQITDLVREQCTTVAPFSLTFDRPAVGRVAVECIARPGPPARQLWQITADATAAVTGTRFPLIPDLYYPHLSLAYGTGDSDTGRRAMKAWLSDDVDTGPVTLPATHLSLVAQSYDMQHITWRHLTDVPLDGPAPQQTAPIGAVHNTIAAGAQVGQAIQLGTNYGDLHI
jgi:2'-5' RNA ligase